MSSTSNSNAAGHQQQEYEESSTTTTATTTPSDEEMELIEEEWEFNAPKYFDFDRLSKLALSNNQHHHHEEELNHSNADQWFFTPDAQHLEFLDPKYIDLNNQADSHPQQQQSNNNNPMMMMNNYETLNDISTISKYSVHQESLGSTTSHQQQQYQLHQHQQYINNNTTNNNTIGTINAFNAIRMTPIKKIKKKVMAKLTIPQTPNFKTDKRIRQRKNETNNNLNNNNTTTTHNTHIVKTVKAIHSSSDSNNNTTNNTNNITRFKTITKPTTPKPFKFRTDSRVLDTDRTTAQIPSNHSPFNKSILQKINDMKSKVPSRWKQKPDIVTPHKPMKITKPNSFKLRTKFRSRINNNNTNMNAPAPPTFKARPLNRKIFESHGELGLSKIIKKEITHPQEFNLMTEERSKKRKFDQSKLLDDTLSTSSMQQQSTIIGGNSENHYNRPLKSRKLDQTSSHSHHHSSTTLGGNSYLVQSTKIEKTIPQSPKLRTKSRATNRSILHEATPNSPHITFRARPLPQSNPFVPIINHTITVPEPFSLSTESRGTIHKKQFNVDEKIPTITFKARPIHHYTNIDTSKITHKPVTVPVSPNITKVKSKKDDSILVSASIGPKLQHYFKARPMPDFNTSSLNKTKNLEMPHVTKSAPFNLETEKRGQAYQSKFKASIQSMERVSISKIDDGTFTSITKRVFNTSIQQLR